MRYWADHWRKDMIFERQRILFLVKVKSCWGGVYDDNIGRTGDKMIVE
jgi:hypothetical protein